MSGSTSRVAGPPQLGQVVSLPGSGGASRAVAGLAELQIVGQRRPAGRILGSGTTPSNLSQWTTGIGAVAPGALAGHRSSRAGGRRWRPGPGPEPHLRRWRRPWRPPRPARLRNFEWKMVRTGPNPLRARRHESLGRFPVPRAGFGDEHHRDHRQLVICGRNPGRAGSHERGSRTGRPRRSPSETKLAIQTGSSQSGSKGCVTHGCRSSKLSFSAVSISARARRPPLASALGDEGSAALGSAAGRLLRQRVVWRRWPRSSHPNRCRAGGVDLQAIIHALRRGPGDTVSKENVRPLSGRSSWLLHPPRPSSGQSVQGGQSRRSAGRRSR